MSSSPGDRAFRCPVCRAGQTISDCCRRCQADLQLVHRAHRVANALIRQLESAVLNEDSQREAALTRELRLLAPKRLLVERR
jgi:hypothetical protein